MEFVPNKRVDKFEKIQMRVFPNEGGISNHKNDYGGLTNHGITIRTFEEYAEKDLGMLPTENNLKKLTKEQASVLYKKRFWEPLRVDEINSISISYILYDFYVNSTKNAVRIMQQSLNSLGANLTVDNVMGSKTIKAINEADSRKLFDAYHQNRIDYYMQVVKEDPSQKVFLKGWIERVNRIKFEG